jgi:hypothetical protein
MSVDAARVGACATLGRSLPVAVQGLWFHWMLATRRRAAPPKRSPPAFPVLGF